MLDPADYRAMPWKNGGGRTLEIATAPAGADLASFAWRISIADVDRDGPFSAFPGVDRTLVLLQGNGMRLVGDAGTLEVPAPYATAAFPGEASLRCELVDGATRDFNLMTRRAAARGTVHVVRAEARALAGAAAFACHAAAGPATVVLGEGPRISLAEGQTLVVEGAAASHGLRAQVEAPAAALLVCAIEAAAAEGPR